MKWPPWKKQPVKSLDLQTECKQGKRAPRKLLYFLHKKTYCVDSIPTYIRHIWQILNISTRHKRQHTKSNKFEIFAFTGLYTIELSLNVFCVIAHLEHNGY